MRRRSGRTREGGDVGWNGLVSARRSWPWRRRRRRCSGVDRATATEVEGGFGARWVGFIGKGEIAHELALGWRWGDGFVGDPKMATARMCWAAGSVDRAVEFERGARAGAVKVGAASWRTGVSGSLPPRAKRRGQRESGRAREGKREDEAVERGVLLFPF
uniref:DUF834 domain-containing protein n=1 Tax=Oryza nivara TaxID=4536 RepID=A0A0E0FKB2_ORYNI